MVKASSSGSQVSSSGRPFSGNVADEFTVL